MVGGNSRLVRVQGTSTPEHLKSLKLPLSRLLQSLRHNAHDARGAYGAHDAVCSRCDSLDPSNPPRPPRPPHPSPHLPISYIHVNHIPISPSLLFTWTHRPQAVLFWHNIFFFGKPAVLFSFVLTQAFRGPCPRCK